MAICTAISATCREDGIPVEKKDMYSYAGIYYAGCSSIYYSDSGCHFIEW